MFSSSLSFIPSFEIFPSWEHLGSSVLSLFPFSVLLSSSSLFLSLSTPSSFSISFVSFSSTFFSSSSFSLAFLSVSPSASSSFLFFSSSMFSFEFFLSGDCTSKFSMTSTKCDGNLSR